MEQNKQKRVSTSQLLKKPYPRNLLLTLVHTSPRELTVSKKITPEMRKRIQRAISLLPEREQLVLRLRFVERKTLADVGAALGVNAGRARRLVVTSLRLLRKPEPWNYIVND